MVDVRKLLPGWLSEGNFLSCRFVEVDGKPSHVGCLLKQEVGKPGRPARWTIHHFPPGERPSGAHVVGLSLAIAGRAVLTDHAGNSHQIEQGNLFQVRQSSDPRQLPLKPEEGFAEFSVFFEPSLADDLLRLGILDREFVVARSVQDVTLVEAYIDLMTLMETHTASGQAVLRRAIALLDVAYDIARRSRDEDDLIERACQLLVSRHEPSFTGQDAAGELGIPYETFRRRFRKQVGMSPGEYQMQHRMHQAIRLLRHHGVQQTSERLGYTDPAYFSRQFKAFVGLSPKYFRPAGTDDAGRDAE